MSALLSKCSAIACVVALAVVLVPSAMGADVPGRPTFYKDIVPVLQENCQSCHRPAGLNMGGMIAPMSLITYREVRPWAKAMVTQVTSKSMPPWDATAEFSGVFDNERTLTDNEIATIANWVKAGAARGNPADAPEPLAFAESEWSFGTPDLVVSMPEPFFVEDDVEDLYADFKVIITEEMLPEPRWISMSESKAGSSAVHHLIARPIGSQAPGGGHKTYPKGFGKLIKAGDEVSFDMHYHKEAGPGTGVWDQSKVAVKFHTEPVSHPITTRPIGNMQFEIPPKHAAWIVGASEVFKEDTTILSLTTHMHLRGKAYKYTAYYPDGTEEVLLDVPDYDFNWQTTYNFAVPKEIPAGTRLDVIAKFDNSPENAASAGFNSERAISFGGPTTDEMMLGWMNYAGTKPVENAEGTD